MDDIISFFDSNEWQQWQNEFLKDTIDIIKAQGSLYQFKTIVEERVNLLGDGWHDIALHDFPIHDNKQGRINRTQSALEYSFTVPPKAPLSTQEISDIPEETEESRSLMTSESRSLMTSGSAHSDNSDSLNTERKVKKQLLQIIDSVEDHKLSLEDFVINKDIQTFVYNSMISQFDKVNLYASILREHFDDRDIKHNLEHLQMPVCFLFKAQQSLREKASKKFNSEFAELLINSNAVNSLFEYVVVYWAIRELNSDIYARFLERFEYYLSSITSDSKHHLAAIRCLVSLIKPDLINCLEQFSFSKNENIEIIMSLNLLAVNYQLKNVSNSLDGNCVDIQRLPQYKDYLILLYKLYDVLLYNQYADLNDIELCNNMSQSKTQSDQDKCFVRLYNLKLKWLQFQIGYISVYGDLEPSMKILDLLIDNLEDQELFDEEQISLYIEDDLSKLIEPSIVTQLNLEKETIYSATKRMIEIEILFLEFVQHCLFLRGQSKEKSGLPVKYLHDFLLSNMHMSKSSIKKIVAVFWLASSSLTAKQQNLSKAVLSNMLSDIHMRIVPEYEESLVQYYTAKAIFLIGEIKRCNVVSKESQIITNAIDFLIDGKERKITDYSNIEVAQDFSVIKKRRPEYLTYGNDVVQVYSQFSGLLNLLNKLNDVNNFASTKDNVVSSTINIENVYQINILYRFLNFIISWFNKILCFLGLKGLVLLNIDGELVRSVKDFVSVIEQAKQNEDKLSALSCDSVEEEVVDLNVFIVNP